ncbi:MAG TPA: hypothetical protein VFH99_03370 [Candidatus Saccharimonadales bacterium]|nr:hypothetical protein [Candidatus Saccharimonadales bacterium]
MSHAVLFPLLFIFQVMWFLTPGLYSALWLARKRQVTHMYIVPVAGVLSCLYAYGAFWLFFINHSLGLAYSVAVGFTGLFLLIRLLVDKSLRKLVSGVNVALPLALWCFGAFFYSSATFACRVTPLATQSDQFCYVHQVTFDNILPKIFADNVYNGHPKALMGDWQASDRPPLQSGASLLEAPLTESSRTNATSYQLLAVFLQVLWIPAVWVLGRKLGLSGGQLAAVLILCFSSGFFFFNSVFVWPKLLAGALASIGFCLLLFEKASLARWSLASAAMALALLAHGGVVFALPPLMILLLTKRFFPGWRIVSVSLASALVLFMPWMAYQHFYDPPGNRLMKWSLAGDTKVDSLGFGQALQQAYTQAGITGSAENKLSNTTTLFYAPNGQNQAYGQGRIGVARDTELRFTFFGLGLLNLGWLGLFMPSFRKRIRQSKINVPRLKIVLGIAVASLAFWVLIMFGPGTTIVQSASYLTMLLLFSGLSALVTLFPRSLLHSLLTLKVAYFILIWILAVYLHHFIGRLYVLYELLALAGITYCLLLTTKHKFTDKS